MTPYRVSLLALSAAAALAAPVAEARNNPAPIVYAPQGDRPAGSASHEAAAPAVKAGAGGREALLGKRIEFRYPDRPDVVYGPDGTRRAANDDPIAFSSSTAAISAERARAYSHGPAPVLTPKPADPAITAGGFDARAEAARVAATQAVGQPALRPANDLAGYSRAGTAYAPQAAAHADETGTASWYGEAYHGNPTANGEIFDMNALSAAHPTLPLPSLVQVVNLDNGRETVVRVNDRGPFIDGRIIDLSKRAADVLGFIDDGTATVRVRYLGPAPVQPSGPAATAAEPAAAVSEAPLPLIATMQPAPQPVRPAPRPRVDAPAMAGEAFYVQLGAFADISNAHRLHEDVSRLLPVEIVEARVRNADFFRVMVGPFAGRDTAEAQRRSLVQAGFPEGLVVARP